MEDTNKDSRRKSNLIFKQAYGVKCGQISTFCISTRQFFNYWPYEVVTFSRENKCDTALKPFSVKPILLWVLTKKILVLKFISSYILRSITKQKIHTCVVKTSTIHFNFKIVTVRSNQNFISILCKFF